MRSCTSCPIQPLAKLPWWWDVVAAPCQQWLKWHSLKVSPFIDVQNVTVKFRRWIKHQNHVTALIKAARIAAAARALSQRLHHRHVLAIPAGPVGTQSFDHKLRHCIFVRRRQEGNGDKTFFGHKISHLSHTHVATSNTKSTTQKTLMQWDCLLKCNLLAGNRRKYCIHNKPTSCTCCPATTWCQTGHINSMFSSF